MNYDEGTVHIDRILPLMGASPAYFQLSQCGLPPAHVVQVEARLHEEGLVIKHTGRVVSLTTEGKRVAQLGASGYSKVLEEKKREKEDSLRTNRVTRITAVASLIISCLAAFVAFKDYQKPDSGDDDIKSLTSAQQSYQVELSALHSEIYKLTKSIDSFRLAAPKVATIDTVHSRKPLPVPSQEPSITAKKEAQLKGH